MNPISWLHLGVLALAGLLCNQNSHAGLRYAPSRDAAVGNAIWDAAVAGRTTTIGGTGGGMTVIGPAAAAVRGSSPGSALVVGGAAAAVAGSVVPVSLSGEIVKDVIIGAIIGCATGGQVGCVLGVATPIAKAFFDASGSRVNPATGVVEHTDPQACTTAPCYTYRAWDPRNGNDIGWFPTAQQACDASWPAVAAWLGTYRISGGTTAGADLSCGGTLDGVFHQTGLFNTSRGPTRTPDAGGWIPYTTNDAFRQALGASDPGPEIVDELGRHGNIVWTLGDPTRPGGAIVTGPSSITGPATTTVNPDGSRSVSTSSTPLSYSGSSVTAGATTTTTKTTAADGSSTGTSTSTVDHTGANPDAPKTEDPPVDSPLPELPKLYTPKYPDGIVGVWRDRKADLTNSSVVQLKDKLLPVLPGGGSCPTWMLPVDTGWHNFGSYNVAPPCWIWDFGRVIIVLSAMFLARALIFGG